jgi:hypothetical protein
MAVRKRNPILGGIMAAAFIGFGGWRLYDHFVLETPMELPYIILGFGVLAYGFYLVYALIAQKDV